MNRPFKRYDDTMLQALATQPFPALILHALIKAVVLVAGIQAISLLSGLVVYDVIQIIKLVVVFGFLMSSMDATEKYWAQYRLKKRR